MLSSFIFLSLCTLYISISKGPVSNHTHVLHLLVYTLPAYLSSFTERTSTTCVRSQIHRIPIPLRGHPILLTVFPAQPILLRELIFPSCYAIFSFGPTFFLPAETFRYVGIFYGNGFLVSTFRYVIIFRVTASWRALVFVTVSPGLFYWYFFPPP